MEIQQAGSGGQWKIRGEIEITDADALHDGLCGMVGGHAVVELDLSEVSHCDPASLQLFCSAVKTATRLGGQLHLSAPSLEMRACCESLGLMLCATGGLEGLPGAGPSKRGVVPEHGQPDAGGCDPGGGHGA